MAEDVLGWTDARLGRDRSSFAGGPLTLVLDASSALHACSSPDGFRVFRDAELVGPPLLWPEVRSSLHESVWRGETPRERAEAILDRLDVAPIASRAPRDLGKMSWRIAERFGWAKTYDAEYVALAQILGCRLVTHDTKLLRRTADLGFVISVADL